MTEKQVFRNNTKADVLDGQERHGMLQCYFGEMRDVETENRLSYRTRLSSHSGWRTRGTGLGTSCRAAGMVMIFMMADPSRSV